MEIPSRSTYDRKEEPISLAYWQWSYYVNHDMREPLVRHFEGPHIGELLAWLYLSAGIANFIKKLNVALHGRPIILARDPFGHRFDAEVVEMEC